MQTFKLPLLKDHHTHPTIGAAFTGGINIRNIEQKSEVIRLIQASTEQLTVVFGWNSSAFRFTEAELETLPPVVICNLSLHGFLLNSAAKQQLEPDYPEIVANIDNPVWMEANIYTILKFLANIQPFSEQRIRDFFEQQLLPLGVWYAEDMLLPHKDLIHLLEQMGYAERTRFWADESILKTLTPDELGKIAGIKLFTDGAIGASTAAISQPFLSGEEGVLIFSDAELYLKMQQLGQYRLPFAIHAIGDVSTRQVVNTLARLRAEDAAFPAVRMEHCQFIDKDVAVKAKALGMVLSMQPNFNSDSIHYADRLPQPFLSRNNPFRMLIDEVGFVPGVDLLFGSDGMPHGAEYALQQVLFPPFPAQALTVDEFQQGYCLPSMAQGYIEVAVDELQKTVSVDVYPAR
ncbi:amidohydrolase family protein [Reinekea marinisedimentorum]|uniref:Putative amidohydrolase YtcJ n=1 Tax=Reinekea marinisedimentorum TaxID=230495 RepID=A0A4R3I516_9GAMM|nr:amidohydrolase family protein [Reinekea marinisedimentorum]TCS40185.1 putative amidohydrolase YtcJ [Reinekea marinisedimentorum]